MGRSGSTRGQRGGLATARTVHAVTFAVVTAALLLQALLVIAGAAVLDETAVPPLTTRLLRLVSYFTIQSNLLVAIATGLLARRPDRDGLLFRVLRLDAVVAITVTGVVHFLLLRPLLDLTGANALADTLLHLVVPLLAVAGWLAVGPRPRVDTRSAALALLWPVAWLGCTLLMGAATGWYPYPFLDAGARGYGPVLVTCAVITALFLGLVGLLALVDRRLPPTPRSPATVR